MDLSLRPPFIPAFRPSLIHKAALAPRERPRPRRRPPTPDEALRRRGSALRNELRNGQGERGGERAAVGARVSSAAKYDDSINVLYQVIVPPVLTLCRNLGHDWLAACLPCLSACLLAYLPARLPASLVGAPDLGIIRVLSAVFSFFIFISRCVFLVEDYSDLLFYCFRMLEPRFMLRVLVWMSSDRSFRLLCVARSVHNRDISG